MSEITENDLRKLSFKEVFFYSFKQVFFNFKEFLKRASLWFFLSSLLFFVSSQVAIVVAYILQAVASIAFVCNWIRYCSDDKLVLDFSLKKREFFYGLRVLQVMLITFAIVLSAFLFGYLSSLLDSKFILFVVITLITLFGVAFIFRISLVLPATALDHKLGIKDIYKVTKGYSLKIFGVIFSVSFVSMLVFVLLTVLFMFVFDGGFNIDATVEDNKIVLLLTNFLGFVYTAIITSAYYKLYRFFYNKNINK